MSTIITFQSVHYALSCESKLLESDFKIALITTPRSVTSNCGFSVEIETENCDFIKNELLTLKIKYDALYEKSFCDGVKYYAKKD